jgi:hypothetical protein
VPERLLVPFRAIVGFVDPHVGFGLKFDATPESPSKAAPIAGILPAAPKAAETTDAAPAAPEPDAAAPGTAAVVSLDAFRKKNG